MTSTATGLPDRYRPLDQVGPDEPTATGVIHSWRAKDRVLNRDVAIRVHTPAGPAAHAWISRALTAGGLATPALAMVYDASEGIGGEPGEDAAPGGARLRRQRVDRRRDAGRAAVRGPDARARGAQRSCGGWPRASPRRTGSAWPSAACRRTTSCSAPTGWSACGPCPPPPARSTATSPRSGSLLEACLTGLDPASPGCGRSPARPTSWRWSAGRGRPSRARACPAWPPWRRCWPSAPSGSGPLSARRRDAPRRPTAAGCASCATAGRDSRRPRRRGAAVGGAPVRLDPHTLPPVPPVRPLTGATRR